MKKAITCLLLAGAHAHQVATPVDKVVSLLTKLSTQVQAEGVAEAASYDKYACFCKAQADDKTYTIVKSDEKIEGLQASLTALTAEMAQLDNDVSESKKDVTKEETTQTEKQQERAATQEKYAKNRKDLAEAVEAVDDALETLRNSKGDVEKQMASLLQKLPADSPAVALIAAATAKPGDAAGYKYASKDIIATLTSLLQTFKKELADADTAEINSRSAHGMAAGARANSISALQKEINQKETLSASKGEEKADKQGLKDEETTARNADQAFLDDLTAKCEAKAEAWDKRSTTRASELTALGQAVELLKGMGGAYGANAKLVGLISKKSKPAVVKHAAFLQTSRQNVDGDKLQWLIGHLNKESHTMNSASLAMLALKIQTVGPDHFKKVRDLIKDLVKKLEADSTAEATTKTFCDKNMKSAVEKRDKQKANMETAGAEIDSTKASIATLKDEVADLSENIAGLNKEVLEATELRAGEKANNEKTLANAKSGKAAVDQAIVLLQDFYGSSLMQAQATPTSRDGKTVGDLAPKTFSSSDEYKGKADSSKGIIGILEVIASDFERTTKTVTDAEADSVADFNKLQSDTEKTIVDKNKLKDSKETDIKSKTSDLTDFKGDMRDAKDMNEQAIDELEKLTASCVETGESYAERVQHRKDEIEALKNAMQILEDWKD